MLELFKEDVETAQANKEAIEVLQRKDRKLREIAAKRRKAGGPKITYPADKA